MGESKLLKTVTILMTLAFFYSCSGGVSAPSIPAEIPVSLEGIDGSDDVSADSSFKYIFSKDVDVETVTVETFFIHAAIDQGSAGLSVKAAYDGDLCDVDEALPASVSCESSTECILDPTSNLEDGQEYTICLTPGSEPSEIVLNPAMSQKAEAGCSGDGILYLDCSYFEGGVFQINTVGPSCETSLDCSDEYVCHVSICKSRESLGFTDIECGGEEDVCGEAEACLYGVDAQDCDESVCVDAAAFFGPLSGVPQTESECEAGGYEWVGSGEEYSAGSSYCFAGDSAYCEAENQSLSMLTAHALTAEDLDYGHWVGINESEGLDEGVDLSQADFCEENYLRLEIQSPGPELTCPDQGGRDGGGRCINLYKYDVSEDEPEVDCFMWIRVALFEEAAEESVYYAYITEADLMSAIMSIGDEFDLRGLGETLEVGDVLGFNYTGEIEGSEEATDNYLPIRYDDFDYSACFGPAVAVQGPTGVVCGD